MTALQFLIGVLGSAAVFKFCVFIFAPQSENSFARAIVTGFLAAVATVVAGWLPQWGVPPLGSLLAAMLSPLLVVKLAYDLSLFRALLVSVLYVFLWSLLSFAAGIRVIRFDIQPDVRKMHQVTEFLPIS